MTKKEFNTLIKDIGFEKDDGYWRYSKNKASFSISDYYVSLDKAYKEYIDSTLWINDDSSFTFYLEDIDENGFRDLIQTFINIYGNKI